MALAPADRASRAGRAADLQPEDIRVVLDARPSGSRWRSRRMDHRKAMAVGARGPDALPAVRRWWWCTARPVRPLGRQVGAVPGRPMERAGSGLGQHHGLVVGFQNMHAEVRSIFQAA